MSNETGTAPRERRVMLALITLAELPMPKDVRFHPNGEILSLTLDEIEDGQAWSRYLGGASDTYVYHGTRYLNEGQIVWHGWSVHVHASADAVADAALDDHTTGRLRELAAAA